MSEGSLNEDIDKDSDTESVDSGFQGTSKKGPIGNRTRREVGPTKTVHEFSLGIDKYEGKAGPIGNRTIYEYRPTKTELILGIDNFVGGSDLPRRTFDSTSERTELHLLRQMRIRSPKPPKRTIRTITDAAANTFPYDIILATGDKDNAGSSAKVFIEFYGEDNRRSGELSLPTGIFDRGKSHLIHKLLPVMLSPLTSVDIGHDNSGESPDWYCEHVIVYSHTTGFKQTFTCHEWILKNDEQNNLSTKLFENTELSPSHIHAGGNGMVQYDITITTGGQANAGTDANTYITLWGTTSSSGLLSLSHCQLEPDSSVRFHREVGTYLGALHKLEIGHDNKGIDPDWFLEKVTVYCVTTNKKQIFTCRKWLSSTHGDCRNPRFLYADDVMDHNKDILNVFSYDITIVTGNKDNSGTDSQVYVSFHGIQQTHIEKCPVPVGKCRRDTSYTFSIELPFAVDYVEVEHDNSGEFPDWFCDHVKVYCHNTVSEKNFRCKRWLSKTVGDGLIKRALYYTCHDLKNKDLQKLCEQYGRTSTEVEEACKRIVLQLLNCSLSFKDVWPMYKASDANKIVFVVFVEKGSSKCVRLTKSLTSFDAVYREIDEINKEENKILEKETIIFSDEEKYDENRLVDILKKSSKTLIDAHSNLNMISASPVKSTYFAYGPDKHNVKRKPCIVLYVCLKGYIPIHEEPLPPKLGKYPTDVREGAFKFFHNEGYLPRLKIGCSVGENTTNPTFGGTGGTLGAFVDLPYGKIGCITSAHSLLSVNNLISLRDMDTGMDYNPVEPTIYQPAPSIEPINNNVPFGYLSSAVYEKGGKGKTGVEIGVITITDKQRQPENGKFPKVAEGYTKESQHEFTSGAIYTRIPDDIAQYTFYKYGARTGLTRGAFRLHGGLVKTGKMDLHPSCELHNQLEIYSVGDEPFAEPGDSGALVLLAPNNDHQNLRAIGILTGGSVSCTKFFVTPIWDILSALNLPLRLKDFGGPTYMAIDDENETTNLQNKLETNFDKIKSNLNETVNTYHADTNTKIAQINDKVEKVENNVGQVKKEIEKLDKKVEGKLDSILLAIQSNRNNSNT